MDLQEEFGLTYLFIAHDLSIVEHISHRIAVMYLGNIDGDRAARVQLYENPVHPYTRALLSAVPLPDPALRSGRTGSCSRASRPARSRKPSGCPFRTRCPLAEPSCAEEMPPLVEVSKDRFVACPVVLRAGGDHGK